jgi:hypothetical protein
VTPRPETNPDGAPTTGGPGRVVSDQFVLDQSVLDQSVLDQSMLISPC